MTEPTSSGGGPARRAGPPLGSISVEFLVPSVVLAVIALAVLWAGVVTHLGLAAVDPAISAEVVAARPSWLSRLGVIVSDAGSPGVMIAVTVIVALTVARRMRHVAPVVICGVVLALLAAGDIGVKDLVARVRPPMGGWAMTTSGFSFPSGHAVFSAGAMIMCVLLSAWSRRTAAPGHRRALPAARTVLASLIIAVVGTSRVVVGVHYPSDVLAGWAIAVIVVGLVMIGAQWQAVGHVSAHPDSSGSDHLTAEQPSAQDESRGHG